MNVFGMTDIGLERDSNQDAYHTEQLPDGSVIAIVCDGMGGVNGGNIASEIACDTIVRCVKQASDKFDSFSCEDFNQLLVRAVHDANSEIYMRSMEQKEFFGMGTTAVAAVIHGTSAHISHVGDSRAYVYKNGDLTQITTDHSFVQELISRGEITETEARTHPQKNLITRAVGIGKKLEVDSNEVELSSGDIMLFCSDGLTNMCTDSEIKRVLEHSESEVSVSCKRLIQLANEYGGADNITAVLVRI